MNTLDSQITSLQLIIPVSGYKDTSDPQILYIVSMYFAIQSRTVSFDWLSHAADLAFFYLELEIGGGGGEKILFSVATFSICLMENVWNTYKKSQWNIISLENEWNAF